MFGMGGDIISEQVGDLARNHQLLPLEVRADGVHKHWWCLMVALQYSPNCTFYSLLAFQFTSRGGWQTKLKQLKCVSAWRCWLAAPHPCDRPT